METQDPPEPELMQTQEDLFEFLDTLDIVEETIEHIPVMTVKDTYALTLPDPVCKNLFLKDRRKNLWLLIALPDTVVNLKKLAKHLDAPELRFADADLLYKTLGVKPGAVSLFGIINDHAHKVTVLIDKAILKQERVGFHPFDHSATTFIRTQDIHPFITACGSPLKEIDCNET